MVNRWFIVGFSWLTVVKPYISFRLGNSTPPPPIFNVVVVQDINGLPQTKCPHSNIENKGEGEWVYITIKQVVNFP